MKDLNNDTNDLIDIMNLTGDYIKGKNNKYYFSLFNSNMRVSSDEIYKVADPSDDQAFKILFNGNYKIDNISGLQRAKSLIQSLLYKFQGKKIINRIEYLQKEIPEISGKNRAKLKVLDCPFLCEMNDKEKWVIDLEMQNYYYNGLDLNSLTYGTSLANAYKYPVVIIVLLLKDTYNNESNELKHPNRFFNETKFKPIDDYVYVFCLDLYYILDCINDDNEPNLDGLQLSQEGKEWIKLFTIKNWMIKHLKGYNDRYPIPKNLINSKEVISAIKILDSYNNSALVKKVLEEKENKIIREEVVYIERINIWIKSFLKEKVVDNSIVPFPEVAPEFLIRECKNKLNKNDCLLFINMLIRNRIIESKEIYKNLIDKIYS